MNYRYIDQGGDHVISDVNILREYYAYWCTQMRRAGKQDQISPRACIEDFCVVHWATPIEDWDDQT